MRHVKSLHIESARIQCQKCGSKIKRKENFLAHMRRCSICSICDVPCENSAACESHKAMVHGIRKRKKLVKLLLQIKFLFLKFFFAVPLKLFSRKKKLAGKNFPWSKLVIRAF